MPVTTRTRTATTNTASTSFLPTALRTRLEKEKEQQAERAAAASNYVATPKDGETIEFRVMSECRWGFEAWYTVKEDGQEKRQAIRWDAEQLNSLGLDEPPAEEIPEGVEVRKDGSPVLKTFLAMVVYNYGEDKFQIWSFTQATIREQFEKACENPRFGDPRGYDFAWSRVGKTMTDTRHTLTALPPAEMNPDIVNAFADFDCDLKAYCMGAPGEEVFAKSVV